MCGPKILCPVDFSEFSDAALATAVPLARAKQGSLYLLHVVEPIPPMGAGHTAIAFTDRDMRELQSRLNDTLSNVNDVIVERYMEHGDPANEIVDFAEEHGIDLIVMGTHGRTGMSRVAMGSVAERIVRKATCAVLTVKQPADALQVV